MKENIMQIVREMQVGSLPGPELEEKEFLVIQELCSLTTGLTLQPFI